MKLKELKKTVNISWSPCDYYPALLAAGSAAQQVDSTFSSTSTLELYGLNLEDSGLDLELKSSLETQHKFQKIVWSGAGIITGGCDSGLLEFYSTDKLLKNASDSCIGSSNKHSGNVSALDMNPYQKNLLASGASDSEIFIWDLNNTSQPMAPGNRSQPYEHVQGLAWNQQVQHILGSTFVSRCVVWDLRKNEPIMKLSDSQSRTRWRSLAWHPSVATQLCIASEDDLVPVIQLWDLRLAASPLLTMEGHKQGVLSLAWSAADSSLLLSAGKDGRVLCWDPSDARPGGEVVQEVVSQAPWVFEVAWCARVPGLLAAAAFDHQLTVHALLAADRPELTSQSQSNIMESFGGLESFRQLPAVQRGPQAAPGRPRPQPQPARAPRWLKRPVAAHFGFGGKLVIFEKCPQEAGSQKLVYISQVVSEPEIVERAAQLDVVLNASLSQDPGAAEQLAEYCRQRGDAATDQNERYTWFFLRANFLPNFRTELLNLLGFKQDEIPSKFKSSAPSDGTHPDLALSRGESTETEAELSTDTSTDLSDAHTLIERKLSDIDLDPTVTNVVIPNGEDSTSLICRALVCGNIEEAVELCLEAKRIPDALIIASLGSPALVQRAQRYHLRQTAREPVSLLAGGLLRARWPALVAGAAPASWRCTLAALLTHCDEPALAHCCEMLGERLEAEGSGPLQEAAGTCYLCAVSAGRLVRRWARGPPAPAALAALTERALLLRRAAGLRARPPQTLAALDAVLQQYAWRLAAQGCLQGALAALQGCPPSELRDRLTRALGLAHDQQAQQQPGQFNRNRTFSAQSQKRGHLIGHNDTSNTYNTMPAPYEQKPWQQTSVPSNPFPNSGFPPQPQPQPLQPQPQPLQPQPQPLQPQPQPPQPLPPQPQPLTQPPRPGSVGSTSGGVTSRSKYKVDPSVQAAPLYNQYSFQQPYSSMPDHYSSASVPNPGFTSNNNTVSAFNPSSGTGPLNPMAPVNPMTPLNPMAPVNPMTPLNPMAPVNPMTPLNPMAPVNPMTPLNPVAPVNPASGALNGGYYGAGEAAHRPVAPGWNDPPVVSAKPKPAHAHDMSALHAGTRQWGHIIEHRRHHDQPKQEVAAPAPITHPLLGAEPQHVPLAGAPPAHYPQPYPAQYPAQGPQYPAQYQQQQTQMYPEQVNQPYQQGRESPAAGVPAAVPAPKPPIPEQYRALAGALDALRADCLGRAPTAQMKRKLEDVQKRLETLYDMLREHRLSDAALSSLQTCASLAGAGDWAGAGRAATSLAAGAEFAAVASFLPGLKVLLQLAEQLQVR